MMAIGTHGPVVGIGRRMIGIARRMMQLEAAKAAKRLMPPLPALPPWVGDDLNKLDVSGFTTKELTSIKAALGGKHGKGGRRGKGGGKRGTGGGKTDLAFGFSNWTADELLAGIAALGPD